MEVESRKEGSLGDVRKALSRQEGGSHYVESSIQPVEFIYQNKLGFCEGNAIKYLCRHRQKGGKQDLLKARHYIDLLIEMEYDDPAKNLHEKQHADNKLLLGSQDWRYVHVQAGRLHSNAQESDYRYVYEGD